jgi:hypothetical protein
MNGARRAFESVMPKRCPECHLLHPASAVWCDCGRSFVDGSIGDSLADRIHARPRSRVNSKIGMGVLAIALACIVISIVWDRTCAFDFDVPSLSIPR